MQIKLIHDECLKFLRRDLNANDTEALQRHIEAVGLDTLLDPEFFDLLRRIGDHQLVVLLATLGSCNSDRAAEFSRWLAAYQCLSRAVTPEQASELCARESFSNTAYYRTLFNAGISDDALDLQGLAPVSWQELEFGIEFLLDAHRPEKTVRLMQAWSTVDKTPGPWLKTCRKLLQRQETTHTRALGITMARTIEKLIDMAPANQETVSNQLQAEAAEFWIKARMGSEAWQATSRYQRTQTSYSPAADYLALRSHLLLKDLPAAIRSAEELMLHLIRSEATVFEAPAPASLQTFDPDAAADTLKRVNKALRSKGLQPFLMSGTLLGYVRDGCILPHDKDVDIGIIGWENQFDVAQALLELGNFHINYDELKGNRLFLFAPKDYRNQVAIDVFFYHDKGDHFLHGIDFQYGYTQNYRFSKFGLKEVDFLGDTFWIPDNPERKLAENYGDWRVPLPGYVVNVESPGICDKGNLAHRVSAHLELLKAMTTKKSTDKIARILQYCSMSGHALISDELHQAAHDLVTKNSASEQLDAVAAP